MLLHFTRTFEALASILGNGFLYLHNETGVLRPAAQEAFGAEMADAQSSGMVCFTELARKDASRHRAKYGQFGVGVSKDWLVEHGARKVTYVEVGSAAYRDYLRRLRTLAPAVVNGEQVADGLANPETRFRTVLALTHPNWAATSGADLKYIQLLQHLQWTQTSKDVAEKEWRMRNPRPYAVKGKPTRKELIELMVHCLDNPTVPEYVNGLMQITLDTKTVLMFTGRASLVLRIPMQYIEAVFCTPEYRPHIEQTFSNQRLRHIKVFT